MTCSSGARLVWSQRTRNTRADTVRSNLTNSCWIFYVLFEYFESDICRGMGGLVICRCDAGGAGHQVAWGTDQPTYCTGKNYCTELGKFRNKGQHTSIIRDDGNMVVNSTAVCGQGQGDLSMVVVLWHKVQLSSCRFVMHCRDWLFVLLCNSCWKMLLTIVLLCTLYSAIACWWGQGNGHAMPGTLRGTPAQVQRREVLDPEKSTA